MRRVLRKAVASIRAFSARFRGRRDPRIAPEYALEQNKLKVVGGIYRLKNGRVDMVA